MLNLEYKNWLIPYVEGTLDARRRAILESRLKSDVDLAAEVDSLRNVGGHLRESAGANRAYQVERSVWPRVEAAIADRKGGVVYSPRFALAGGLAAIAIVAVTWIGGGHNQTPAPLTIASSSTKASTSSTSMSHGNAVATPVAPTVHRGPVVMAKNPASSAPPVVVARNDDDGPHLAPSLHHESRVDSRHTTVDLISDPGHNDLHSPFAEDSNDMMPPSAHVSTNSPATPGSTNQSRPSAPVTMAMSDRVNVNDGLTIWTVSNGELMNATTRPGDALLGINAPRMNTGRGNKAVSVKAFMNASSATVNLSSHADDSLSTLRDLSVDLINSARPNTVHDALNSWRDTLMVDLNTTVDQNSTTSSQADETLGMLQDTGHLADFQGLMRDECQSRPQEIASWRVLAHVNSVIGLPAEAVNAWVEVTKSSTASAEDWYQLGLALEANHNSAGAVTAYNQVVVIGEPSRLADVQSRLATLRN